MRRLSFLFVFIFCMLSFEAFAYSVSCSGIPGSGGCNQCFHFELAQNNSSQDRFVPRNGLTTGQTEAIYLNQSSVTASALQGASVTPTGTITNLFDLVETGPNTGWVWARMKS